MLQSIENVGLQSALANFGMTSEGQIEREVGNDGVSELLIRRAVYLAQAGVATRFLSGPTGLDSDLEKEFSVAGSQVNLHRYASSESLLAAVSQQLSLPGVNIATFGDFWKVVANPKHPQPDLYARFLRVLRDNPSSPFTWETYNVGTLKDHPYPDMLPVFTEQFTGRGVLIAGSHAIRNEAIAAGMPETSIRLLYPPIDKSQVEAGKKITREQAREILHLPQDEIIISCVNRIAPGKMVNELLQAWKEMQAGRLDADGQPATDNILNRTFGDKKVTLLIVGGVSEGIFQEEYDAWVTEANSPHTASDLVKDTVRAVGEIRDEEKVILHQRASDIGMMPSEAEGYSLVVLRNLALGMPFIANEKARANSGVGELVLLGSDNTKTGVTFTAFTGEEIARAIVEADEERELLASNAARHIASGGRYLDHAESFSEIMSIYQRLARGRQFKISIVQPQGKQTLD